MTPERHDNRESAAAAIIALTAFAVLCVLMSAVGAAEYSVTVEPSAYVVTFETAKPKAEAKPEIWTFYAPFHCPPCVTQKADIKAWKDAPFAFRNGDVNNAPVVIESYPTTAWRADGKWWSYSGWHGIEHLEREWKRSSGKAITQRTQQVNGHATAMVSSSRTAALKQFAGSYKGPTTGVRGSTLSHLMEPKHGFKAHELQGLSEWELERLHSAVHHYGLHASRLRQMAQERGL